MLLNPWKHHAGALRRRVREAVAAGVSELPLLARRLVVIGTELMDLYTGELTPSQIAAGVVDRLRAEGRFEPEPYRDWITASGGYAVLSLEDGSEWVLRPGAEGGRYVHVHPGRWVKHTLRVRANVLKTAVMALACAGVEGGDPADVALVNRVRREHLGLAPLGREPSAEQGIGAVIALLKGAS